MFLLIQCSLTVPVAETDVSVTIQCSLTVPGAETDVSIIIQCSLTVPIVETDVSITTCHRIILFYNTQLSSIHGSEFNLSIVIQSCHGN